MNIHDTRFPATLAQLEQRDDFVGRHVGPDAAETRAMLDVLRRRLPEVEAPVVVEDPGRTAGSEPFEHGDLPLVESDGALHRGLRRYESGGRFG